MAEAANDATITVEAVAVNDVVVLVEDVMAIEIQVQEVADSDHEAIVLMLRDVKADFHPIVRHVKADLKVRLHEENQVRLKEKEVQLHAVRKEVLTDQQVARLMQQKAEDHVEVNSIFSKYYNSKFQLIFIGIWNLFFIF